MSTIVRRRALRLSLDEGWEKGWVEDEVAVDVPVEILVEEEPFRTLLASPGQEREFAVGHLFAEGIIDSVEEVEKVTPKGYKVFVYLKTDRRLRLEASNLNRLIIPTCGPISNLPNLLDRLRKPQIGSQIRVSPKIILGMIRELNLRAGVYKATGGTHSAMLCGGDGEVLAFAEDVGRHNAVDKVIGRLALEGGDFSGCVLISTGRQSSYMVLKAARVGTPVVVSQAGPIDSGVEVAEETGITLICFARGERMNIYTHPERILLDRET